MKTTVFAVFAVLLFALQSPVLLAGKLQEYRDDAQRYYLEQDFKKAYRIYYKLAKAGDHYAQDKVSHMYANGEGKSIDLEEAYAWSVLAAESGREEWVSGSAELYAQTDDKAGAEKKAEKLMKRYGKTALRRKALQQEKRDSYKRSGACTGSHIACANG